MHFTNFLTELTRQIGNYQPYLTSWIDKASPQYLGFPTMLHTSKILYNNSHIWKIENCTVCEMVQRNNRPPTPKITRSLVICNICNYCHTITSLISSKFYVALNTHTELIKIVFAVKNTSSLPNNWFSELTTVEVLTKKWKILGTNFVKETPPHERHTLPIQGRTVVVGEV